MQRSAAGTDLVVPDVGMRKRWVMSEVGSGGLDWPPEEPEQPGDLEREQALRDQRGGLPPESVSTQTEIGDAARDSTTDFQDPRGPDWGTDIPDRVTSESRREDAAREDLRALVGILDRVSG